MFKKKVISREVDKNEKLSPISSLLIRFRPFCCIRFQVMSFLIKENSIWGVIMRKMEG